MLVVRIHNDKKKNNGSKTIGALSKRYNFERTKHLKIVYNYT